MYYWVYLLQSPDGSIYTGYAKDPVARLHLHRTGKGARYTRMKDQINLKGLLIVFGHRSQAMSLEAQIKTLKAEEKRKLLNTNSFLSFARKRGFAVESFACNRIEKLLQKGEKKIPDSITGKINSRSSHEKFCSN